MLLNESSNIEISYKGKILVVEDDSTLLDSVVHRLDRKYLIEIANNGLSALNLISSGYEPDVIVAGQYLSDMNGAEFLRQSIKLLPNSIRMIISSNYDNNDIVETMNHGNALISLIKPIHDIELIQAIEYCLRQRRINNDIEWLDSFIRPKVLVADDSKVMLQLMTNLLKSINAEVFKANDGVEALEIFEQEQNFDLVILDIIMPNLDGYAACKRIREVYSIYELPILFLTSLSESADIVRGFDLGANDYLLKPFKSEELIVRAKTLIKLHRLTQSTTTLKEVIETKNNTLKRLQDEISYREIIEKQLIEQREKADAANRMKSEFLANMSHEIRTPLNAIIGFSELLIDRISDVKNQDYLDSIVSSGKNLLTLINDILDLSKIEANKIDLEYAPFNIKDLMLEITGIFRLRAQSKGIDFRTNIDEILNYSKLILDEHRIRQILINLVGNAIKFTEKGYVEISLKVDFNYNNNNIVDLYIDISDSGIGIAHDQFDAIFEAFQQHTKQSHKAFGGTGLGLTITRKFIQMMNGTINLSSEVGIGSKFTIKIPNVEIETNQISEISYISNLKYEFENPKILLVDDNEHNRKLIIEFLSRSSVQIFEAENGHEAVLSYIQNQPDLVLMDLIMPVMDGFEAIHNIKMLDSYDPKVPIIGLTALAYTTEKEKILQLGFNGYMSKPIQIDDLFRELAKHLPHSIVQGVAINSFDIDDSIAFDIPSDKLILLIQSLEEKTPQCQELLLSRKTRQIKEFAKDLQKIGSIYDASILIEYSDRLNLLALNFDMDGIKKVLSEFSKIINILKSKL